MKNKLLPFILTAAALAADQVSKAIIAINWPEDNTFIADVFGGGLLWIYHVRNTAIAFSLGHNLPDFIKPVLFVALPLGVLAFLIRYYLKTSELSALQRWSLAGILGGGLGNLTDRIFRPAGVVDFISVKFFGLQNLRGGPLAFLSWDRWPTFNLADSFVVIFGILLLITIFRPEKKIRPEKKAGGGAKG